VQFYLILGLQGLLLYIIFSNIRKVPFRVDAAILIIILTSLLTILLTPLISTPAYGNIAINFSFVIVMVIISNVKLKNFPLSIFYAIITCIIAILSVSLSSAFFSAVDILSYGIISIGRSDVIGSFSFSMTYLSIALVIAFFISRHIGIAFHKRICHLDNQLQRKLSIYLLIGAVITLWLFFINVFLHNLLAGHAILTVIYVASLSAFFTFLTFAIFTFIDNTQKSMNLQHKGELLYNLESHTQHVEHMATEMRQFKHDHMNLMLGFRTHLESGDIYCLREYYKKYMSAFTEVSDTAEACMEKLNNIQMPELKTIIFLKFLQAQRLGINIGIEVEKSVTIVGDYNLLDICRIAGIFMDNAIEACEGQDGAIIRFMGAMSGENAHFVFQNTCKNPPLINQINKKGFTTKDSSRGMGLYNVSQLIKKNGRLALQTKIDGEYFTQELKIVPEIL